jgi:hypothetical protein
MKLRSDFCIFVISHNKPDNDTIKQLNLDNCHYPIYLVIDDKDSCIDDYIHKYGKDKVLIFNKDDYSKKCDMMDNFSFDKVIVYARNACYDFAEKLGYKYFLQLDDDYTEFSLRIGKYLNLKKSNIDFVFTKYVDFYEKFENIKILAMLQGGECSGVVNQKVLRKTMNVLFCSTSRRVIFNGRLNEDVNAYTQGNKIGELFLSFPMVVIHQHQSQTTGGMSETYKEFGTYVKSFYSVMQNPSFVKIGILRSPSSFRIHHKINKRFGVVKVISSRYKK